MATTQNPEGHQRGVQRFADAACCHVLRFLPYHDAEVILGDLEERSQPILKKQGSQAARRFIRRQLIRSIPPLAWAKIKTVSGWSDLTEWWKRIGR